MHVRANAWVCVCVSVWEKLAISPRHRVYYFMACFCFHDPTPQLPFALCKLHSLIECWKNFHRKKVHCPHWMQCACWNSHLKNESEKQKRRKESSFQRCNVDFYSMCFYVHDLCSVDDEEEEEEERKNAILCVLSAEKSLICKWWQMVSLLKCHQ